MNSIFSSKIVTVLLVVAIGWFSISVLRVRNQRQAVDQDNRNMAQKVASLEQEQKKLEEDLAYAQSQAYIDREARIKLNYKLPDEKVVFVYPAKTASLSSVASASSESWRSLGKYKKWFYGILGLKTE